MAPRRKKNKHNQKKNKKFPPMSGCNQKYRNRKASTEQNCPMLIPTKNCEKNMSMLNVAAAWAAHTENFVAGASWQLKWQVAYWKARAESLEFENRKLHEVIHLNMVVPTTSKDNASDSESDCQSEESKQSASSQVEETDTDDELEVSKEYIQFLIDNEKYRQDAKIERERFKKKFQLGPEESEGLKKNVIPGPEENEKDMILRKKNLYGENYKRIVALEQYLMSSFQAAKKGTMYWPNIPLNIKFD